MAAEFEEFNCAITSAYLGIGMIPDFIAGAMKPSGPSH
jgi:hypothetical protein